MDEVRALVVERQRYEEWLAALDARKAETPARVYDRVRADYLTREREVLGRLAAHLAELERLHAGLTARQGELAARLDLLGEQRVEGMIRNAVGEYDDAQWQALHREVEGRLAALGEEHRAVQAELEEIAALLAQARPAEPSVGDGAAVATSIVTVPDDPPTIEPPTVEPADSKSASTWLDVVVAAAEPEVEPGPSPSAAFVARFDDLAFLRAVIPPAGSDAAGATADADSATAPSKTLRCTECGTLNLPTEWYCERCGGELAAF